MDAKIKALTEELAAAAESYYNSGTSLMSDKEYDAKFDELKKLEEAAGIGDGFTSKVGARTEGRLAKVTHEFEALSLGKTKDADEIISAYRKVFGDRDAEACLSWKLDGSTVQATYDKGKLILAATRGDGKVGQDITSNSRYLTGLPRTIPCEDRIVVRGEAVMSYREFERLNTDGQFANPRNLANATISALDEEVLKERKVEFRAFELVHHSGLNGLSFGERLDYLENELGIKTVPHKVIRMSTLKDEIKEWSDEEKIEALGFPVDGLVVSGNDTKVTEKLQGTGHHPHLVKGMAFKWQDETAETILRDIEWSPSRTGLLNPVAVFDTVELCGTKVSRASLHNVSYIDGLKLKIGDRLTVYKANMIIPQIDENLDKNKEGASPTEGVCCPCCKTKAEIRFNYDSGTKVMVCPNEECKEKELGRLTHFVSKHGMNIEGLSEKTLEMLMDNGFVSSKLDLFSLDRYADKIRRIDGFGDRATFNLLTAVEKAKKECDFSHFLYSLGIPNFGRGQIKLLKDYIDSHPELWNEYPDYYITIDKMVREGFDFTGIDGIGRVLADNFVSFWKKTDWMELIDTIDPDLEIKAKPVAAQTGLSGKAFCITGSLTSFPNRDACVAFIEENGGKFVSGVSKNTDYLVNNDITSTSGKNKKAKDLGIPIITEQQLIGAANGSPLPSGS